MINVALLVLSYAIPALLGILIGYTIGRDIAPAPPAWADEPPQDVPPVHEVTEQADHDQPRTWQPKR